MTKEMMVEKAEEDIQKILSTLEDETGLEIDSVEIDKGVVRLVLR